MPPAVEIRSIVDGRGQVLRSFPVNPGAVAFDATAPRGAELMAFSPSFRSADADILPAKQELDAKSRQQVRNDGYVNGARKVHVDNVVGHQFKLNAKPSWRLLQQVDRRLDEVWARDFAQAAEARFENWADDPVDCWVDAQRVQSFTPMVRMIAGQLFDVGEVLATAEWLARGPYHTAIQNIDPDRLSNPLGQVDSQTLRRGVRLTSRGEPVAYYVRSGHPFDGVLADVRGYRWRQIRRYKRWGRAQVIHLFDRDRPGQNRGVGLLVSVLQELETAQKYKKLVLQNMAVNAMYAATLESDLDRELALQTIGVAMPDGTRQDVPWMDYYMQQLADYSANAPNLKLDGVKIPHLPPGTKLNFQSAAGQNGIGESFERSLHRNLAAGFGMSEPEFTRDLSNTNYSSIRFGLAQSWKFYLARRRTGPAAYATHIYTLWLEEAMARQELPLPVGAPLFWEQKRAYSTCAWHGAGRGQVDPVKETQASVLKVASGLSTYEREMAELHGEDWRDVFDQQQREQQARIDRGLPLIKSASIAGGTAAGSDPQRNPSDKRPANQQAEASEAHGFELTTELPSGKKPRIRAYAYQPTNT